MTSLRYFLPASQLNGKQMAPRLLQDIACYAWGENLVPLKSGGGRKGDVGRQGKAGVTFTLLAVQISSHHTTIRISRCYISWRHMQTRSQLPSLQLATKPSFIIFLRGNDLGHALRSWKEQKSSNFPHIYLSWLQPGC